MNLPRFSQITILHGKDDTVNGQVQRLESILKAAYPMIDFQRPLIPNLAPKEACDWIAERYVQRFKPGSLLVGLERGGLIACAIQSKFPALKLSAVAINAPTGEGDLHASTCLNSYSRMALYSSAYPPIKSNCGWHVYSPLAFDVTWLAKGCDAYYPLAYLISAFMGNKDMEKEVALMFPPSV
jgi:hypothetical protein